MKGNTPLIHDTRLLTRTWSRLRYSMDGSDDLGYTMLHRAIRMAESLGIVNSPKRPRLREPYMSKDMILSVKQTAWGLFQIDT